MDDAQLVKRAASGDRQAAGEIYDRYAPLVRAVALDATGSLAEAQEIVQQVFLRALGRIDRLRQGDHLAGWLVTIARREGTEYRRRVARQRRQFSALTEDPPSAVGAGADEREEIDTVRRVVRQLPERERTAIHLHYLCDEGAEVARGVLGLSLSGYYKLLERARTRLRALLLEKERKP